MNIKSFKIILVLTLFLFPATRADEGMWIPLLIEKYNIKLMQEKGFRLSSEYIYSVNKACMKDAIVQFGGGCTGEIISSDGLLITNHHCGYSQIQKHSSLQNDYLTDGFWAMSRKEELSNPGLTVTFLKRMEDVTDKVMQGVTDAKDNNEREKIISSNIKEIAASATASTGYIAIVRPFYMGKQYFLFVNEIFRDIRLVGAPPSAIGKFGGETDNWVWPRHTGDFSIFRIYAGKDNKPADYSVENVPYKPLYHFPISLKGVREGDFTMVLGYPGTTTEYVPSYHIDMIKNKFNPKMIGIRTRKIEIMESAMKSDPMIRIQYSSKKAGLANSWKKWIGESQGLEKMTTIAKKQEYENRLIAWINEDSGRIEKYGNMLSDYRELYSLMSQFYVVNSYTNEVFFNSGTEAIAFARNIKPLADLYKTDFNEDQENVTKINLLESGKNFFKNYNAETDKKLFIALMTLYGENVDPLWQAPEYVKLRNSCKGDFASVADKLYSKSIFTNEARFSEFVTGFQASAVSKLNKDPFFKIAMSVSDFLSVNIRPELTRINDSIQRLNRKYMTAQMEFEKDRVFYPDANSTLRVAYGNIKGYLSKDAVYYSYFTTLRGIMEKDNPGIYDYDVPARLRELYRSKDYGRYVQDGEVPVCFIADNHTTGGNSGSPVINADGQLIGVNFDRAWEGVASDIAFNPEQSRNISLDIRYALFIIDKFAGAGYLLKEMTIVQ
ncbi:MAG: S46 family peptidase [Bacteroidales bacterium]|nr:S46 family peptidase [Bacteroidales bacterium]